MVDSAQLDMLLLEWEERWEQGEVVPAETLCQDRPEYLEALRNEIEGLAALDDVLNVDDFESPGDHDGAFPEIPGYEIVGELGRGGMGIVYEARDRNLNRQVALKMLLTRTWSRRTQQLRFQREAQVLARLSHDHIVPIYEAKLHDGRPYFVMQFVRGCLAGQMDRYTRNHAAAASLMEKVARAVHYAHEQGVLHRDLKPANVLLNERGKSLISDFGLAKLLAHRRMATDEASYQLHDSELDARRTESEAPLTHDGGVAGTLAYMAPEQLEQDRVALTPAADIFCTKPWSASFGA